MNCETLPPIPGMIPIPMPMALERTTTDQCRIVSHMPLRMPERLDASWLAMEVLLSMSCNISAPANSPTTSGMRLMPSHR